VYVELYFRWLNIIFIVYVNIYSSYLLGSLQSKQMVSADLVYIYSVSRVIFISSFIFSVCVCSYTHRMILFFSCLLLFNDLFVNLQSKQMASDHRMIFFFGSPVLFDWSIRELTSQANGFRPPQEFLFRQPCTVWLVYSWTCIASKWILTTAWLYFLAALYSLIGLFVNSHSKQMFSDHRMRLSLLWFIILLGISAKTRTKGSTLKYSKWQ